jgi:hypothetical protein
VPRTPEQSREYNRDYYFANRDRILRHKREHGKPSRTPEENREYMRAYYAANRERWNVRTTEQRANRNAARRERYANDPEFREQAKEAARNRDKRAKRDGRLRAQFGIGVDEYDAILLAQGGGCAICGNGIGDGRGHRLHVDHCHGTGIVRGILCSGCNLGLGKFADDPERLERAAEYLRRSRAVGHLV